MFNHRCCCIFNSVESHRSLQVERHIRILSNFLKVNLNQFENDWVRFITPFHRNFWATTARTNLLGREAPNLTNLRFNPMSGLSLSYQEYVSHLKDKFSNISRTMLSLQRYQQENQNVQLSNKLSENPFYTVG